MVLARLIWRSSELSRIELISVDLPEPDTPVTATKSPRGMSTRDVLQVVGPRALDGQLLAVARAPGRGRRRWSFSPDRYWPVIDSVFSSRVLVGARVHDLAAELAGPRADVDDEVGEADRLLVVLDHDDRVAQVAQALEGRDEPTVVALVQSDRGLVEHVEHAHQVAADLAGETDALGLAARQRRRGAAEGQVVEARRPSRR